MSIESLGRTVDAALEVLLPRRGKSVSGKAGAHAMRGSHDGSLLARTGIANGPIAPSGSTGKQER